MNEIHRGEKNVSKKVDRRIWTGRRKSERVTWQSWSSVEDVLTTVKGATQRCGETSGRRVPSTASLSIGLEMRNTKNWGRNIHSLQHRRKYQKGLHPKPRSTLPADRSRKGRAPDTLVSHFLHSTHSHSHANLLISHNWDSFFISTSSSFFFIHMPLSLANSILKSLFYQSLNQTTTY